MTPSDIQFWLKAQPFIPFRIVMVSGRTYDVPHPELIRVLRGGIVRFTPSGSEDFYDRAEMIGLGLIDKIEPIAQPTQAT
jgi:hypothetical protein